MKIFTLEHKHWWVGTGVHETTFVAVWISFLLGEEDGCEAALRLGVLGRAGGGLMLPEFLCIAVASLRSEDLFTSAALHSSVGETSPSSSRWWHNWLAVSLSLNWEDEYSKNGLLRDRQEMVLEVVWDSNSSDSSCMGSKLLRWPYRLLNRLVEGAETGAEKEGSDAEAVRKTHVSDLANWDERCANT